MIVSVETDIGRLFDVDGDEIFDCVWANLETGECEVYQDNNGQYVVDSYSGKCLTEKIRKKPPLLFIRSGDIWCDLLEIL